MRLPRIPALHLQRRTRPPPPMQSLARAFCRPPLHGFAGFVREPLPHGPNSRRCSCFFWAVDDGECTYERFLARRPPPPRQIAISGALVPPAALSWCGEHFTPAALQTVINRPLFAAEFSLLATTPGTLSLSSTWQAHPGPEAPWKSGFSSSPFGPSIVGCTRASNARRKTSASPTSSERSTGSNR